MNKYIFLLLLVAKLLIVFTLIGRSEMTILEDESEHSNAITYALLFLISGLLLFITSTRVDWIYASLGILALALTLGIYSTSLLFVGETKHDDNLDDLGKRLIKPIIGVLIAGLFLHLLESYSKLLPIPVFALLFSMQMQGRKSNFIISCVQNVFILVVMNSQIFS